MESARMYPGRTFYYYYEHANEIGYKKVYEQGFGLSSEYKYGELTMKAFPLRFVGLML